VQVVAFWGSDDCTCVEIFSGVNFLNSVTCLFDIRTDNFVLLCDIDRLNETADDDTPDDTADDIPDETFDEKTPDTKSDVDVSENSTNTENIVTSKNRHEPKKSGSTRNTRMHTKRTDTVKNECISKNSTTTRNTVTSRNKDVSKNSNTSKLDSTSPKHASPKNASLKHASIAKSTGTIICSCCH